MDDTSKAQKPKLGKRIAGYSLTTAVIALAAGLAVFGSDTIAARAERLPTQDAAPPVPVTTELVAPQSDYTVTASYPGRMEARRKVALGFEQAGTIAKILVEEGDRLVEGDIVARLDTRTLDAARAAEIASRAAIAAQAELAQITAERQRTLVEQNHVATQRYDEARLALTRLEAELAAADARISTIEVAISKAEIAAPFAAAVGARTMDEGTTTGPGQPVATLIEARAPEFRAGVPDTVASGLTVGQAVSIRLGDATYPATVTAIRDDIDPATRTVPVLMTVSAAPDFPDGTLGRLVLERRVTGDGAWVPLAALTEGLRGLWTLYVVEAGNDGTVARREAVELVHTDGERAYVRGLFAPDTRVVVTGPHRLADGQRLLPEG